MSERIKMMFQFMEYDELTENEESFVISVEEQFKQKGELSSKQEKVLEDIFRKAASRVEWSR